MRRLAAAFGAAALAITGCSSATSGAGNNLPTDGSTSPVGAGRVSVVAAENFWGDITKQIGGDRVAVSSIISDPDADPHTYETNASTAAEITKASFVIVNGAGYDDFVSKLLDANPNAKRAVVTVADVVGASSGDANPHLWYSPDYVGKVATAIETQLATVDPSGANSFQASLRTFLAEYQDQVVSVIEQIKTKYAGTKIAYTERVPGYLISASGLELGTPASFSQAIEAGNDPSPGDTAAFQAALQHHTVKVLLYNSQVTSPTTQRLRDLATSASVPVVGVSETLPPKEKSFQSWQADQAKALLAALGG